MWGYGRSARRMHLLPQGYLQLMVTNQHKSNGRPKMTSKCKSNVIFQRLRLFYHNVSRASTYLLFLGCLSCSPSRMATQFAAEGDNVNCYVHITFLRLFLQSSRRFEAIIQALSHAGLVSVRCAFLGQMWIWERSVSFVSNPILACSLLTSAVTSKAPLWLLSRLIDCFFDWFVPSSCFIIHWFAVIKV